MMRELQGKSNKIWDFNVTRLHELTSEDRLEVQMDPLCTTRTKESKTEKDKKAQTKQICYSHLWRC